MSDLISRRALLKSIGEVSTSPLNEWDTMGVLNIVNKQPTVEAKELVHAKWIDGCCSNCGAYIPTDSLWDYISEKECNFCYSCGCDMRGENDVE